MLEKKATTQVPIDPLIARRWSPRAFDPKRDVSVEQIIALLEAARWAPSCGGGQPWRMIACPRNADEAAWQRVLDNLSPGNAEWARFAPLLLVAAADGMFQHKPKPNRWGQYDTGAATENLCLQATSMGLIAHQMGGFDADALRSALEVPEQCALMAVLAIGYPLPVADIPDALREREHAARERLPLGENFFLGRWGVPMGRGDVG